MVTASVAAIPCHGFERVIHKAVTGSGSEHKCFGVADVVGRGIVTVGDFFSGAFERCTDTASELRHVVFGARQ